MAEQGSVYDLKGLEQQLQSLFSRYIYNQLQADIKPYCSSFCKLVEHYASHWKVPLPQLRILEKALCYFTQASAFFSEGCDHVLGTLSSLALSVFELLLFFDQKDFTQDPLRKITVAFQECCLSLARFQNVHLLQVERLLRAGGPWANQTLLAILSESTLPQTEVEECIGSEPPVFFELRVRYLLACQQLPEAQALAKCCAQHHTVGQHSFFFQVYLTGLYKAAQHEHLLEEVADFSGRDAVNFICSLESEENDDLLLDFSRVFLSQQLRRGDMHFLCDLVCIWGRLHRRLKTSKEVLLKECEQLIMSATNVNAIFPFIRAIMQELNEEGVQFCMELCANALRSCTPCDVITKSLIYKTMASLVPNDLEICRACALLVFFLERSVEAYKMVYILYMHPDQEYHVDCCPIGNRVRFETLQILKKDLYFDPEFWNLIALRTNCLKLMNEKVLNTALEEIMEEKWVPSYCLKETKSSSTRSKFTKNNGLNKEKTLKGDQQNHKDTADKAPAKKVGRPRLNKHLPLKKGNQGSRQWKDMSTEPTRRSAFWQLERIHCNRALDSRENRRTTRLSEKVPAKRMIKTPKWLLEDSGTIEKNAPVMKRQYPSFPYLPLRRRRVAVKNNTADNAQSEEKLKENQINEIKQRKEVPQDSQIASTAPQVVLELSLPDNELLGTFTDEPCNWHRGIPQKLFYRPTLKVPSENKPEKASLCNEVILKAQDTTSFILMLHCYSKRPKGKKIRTNSQALPSTETCSSDQVDASHKDQLNNKPAVEMKVTISSQTHQMTDPTLKSSRELLHENGTVTKDTDTVTETEVTGVASIATTIAESTVEMEAKVVTQKNRHSPRIEKAQNTEDISSVVSMKATPVKDNDQVDGKPPQISAVEESKSQEAIITNGEVLVNGTPNQEVDFISTENNQAQFKNPTVKEAIAETNSTAAQTPTDSTYNLPSVTESESKTEMHQSQDKQKYTATLNSDPEVSEIENDDPEVSKSEKDYPAVSEMEEDYPEVSEIEEDDLEVSETEKDDSEVSKMEKNDPEVSNMEKDDSEMAKVEKDDSEVSKLVKDDSEVSKCEKDDSEVSKLEKDVSKALPTTSSPSNTAWEDDGFDPMEPQPECEESKLEFCCFFCHKDVKGRHLVAHAMFHYRKDECMFCGVPFKNNLKAMMHMSNHLEKLKKLQNPTAHSSPKQSRAKAKRKDPIKAKTVSNEKKRRGREKKPLPTVRKLRCGYKFRNRTKQEDDSAKDSSIKEQVHKVNGHIVMRKKRKGIERTDNNLIIETRLRHRSNENHRNNDIKAEIKIEKEKRLVISSEEKHEENSKTSKQTDINKTVGPQEKLCCPVDGCTWFTIKKHATFLYHVLENHYPDTKPLELAFSLGNNSCSICKRVLYGFEHFKHHVGRHRSVPRHPCPHKGCTARFKTTIEMRRHARKHSPLQAVCCLPGCPKLFICQWALILHEKDHFSKRSKTAQSNDKPKSNQAAVKQEKQEDVVIKKCWSSKEKFALTSADKSPKDTNKTSISALPKKDLSAQCAATRLLQRLRKRQITKSNLSQQKTLKMVSSFGKPNCILRQPLQRRENKVKESKMLPPRQAKSSQNASSVKNIVLEKESNQEKNSKLHKKLNEGKKISDGSKVKSTGKLSTRTKRLKRMIERNVSSRSNDDLKITNSKRTVCVQKKSKKATLVDDSPVMEKHTNMDTTDMGVEMAAVRNEKGLKNDSVNEVAVQGQTDNIVEKVACQSEISKISNPPTVDYAFIENIQDVADQNEQKTEAGGSEITAVSSNGVTNMATSVTEVNLAPLIENSAEEKLEMEKDNMVCKAQECAQEPGADLKSLSQENSDSSENTPVNIPTFANMNVACQVRTDKGAEEYSDMVSPTKAPSNEQTVSPQDAEKEIVTIDGFALTDESGAKSNVKNSEEMVNGPTLVDNFNYAAFESTLQVTNKAHFAAVDMSILEKLESTELTANANTSQMEEVGPKESENTTTEETVFMDSPTKNESAMSDSLSETSELAVAQKHFKPKFCNKNDILSALKTLVKSKNDQVKIKSEVKNSATKRKNELIKMASKRFKSEVQTREDVAASVSDEKKATETTDSPAASSQPPTSTLPALHKTSKEKQGKVRKVRKESRPTNKKDVVKKRRTVQNKIQKKPRTANKNVVEKMTKKRKRKESEAKTAKPKSKESKTEAKASATLDTPSAEVCFASSVEVNSQSMPTEDNSQAGNDQDYNRKDDNINKEMHVDDETKSEIPRKAPVQNVKDHQDATCLKQREVYDLVPEEEENPLAAFEKALNEYKKRPYMRLPATAYLEEKFTVMPKRRKDMSMFFGSSQKIQTTPQPRQRCVNCFTTFSSEEELQWHLQQKCSNLFGFDSDEEGTS